MYHILKTEGDEVSLVHHISAATLRALMMKIDSYLKVESSKSLAKKEDKVLYAINDSEISKTESYFTSLTLRWTAGNFFTNVNNRS